MENLNWKRITLSAGRHQGVQPKDWPVNGVKKLEGRTHTLAKRKCPPSVKINDEAAIPSEFKRLTVTLPLAQSQSLLAAVPEEVRKEAVTAVQKQEESVNLVALKEALNLEKQGPGTDLILNLYSLQLR